MSLTAAEMESTATIEAYQGTTGAGERVYGAPTTVACHAEVTTAVAEDGSGEALDLHGKLLLPAAALVVARDRITVAGAVGYAAKVQACYGATSPSHVEVELD